MRWGRSRKSFGDLPKNRNALGRTHSPNKLFTPVTVGTLLLKNRVVMAPKTHSRAIENIPNDLMAKYYSDRAEAGLLITEGTSPSPNGHGYARIPGLFSAEQVTGWKKVTSVVHAQDGKIFVQLMHIGRISHRLNLPTGARIVAPSAVHPSGTMFTDQRGLQEYPVPNEMTRAEIAQARDEFVASAALAIEAGFDGVELQGANGYLLEQFLNPSANHRKDEYGETETGRMRFLLEVVDAVAKKIGAGRLGVRVLLTARMVKWVPFRASILFTARSRVNFRNEASPTSTSSTIARWGPRP